MKIGLVSFHKEPNFGTMLQAYALHYIISLSGHESEYINYIDISEPNKIKFLIKSILKKIIFGRYKGIYSFWNTKQFCKTLAEFHTFHAKYIPTSSTTYYKNTIEKTNKIYDNFIVGSDQTWSAFLNKSDTSLNFLYFVTDNKKKNAYAPSLGTININNAYLLKLKTNLSSFNKLSCREKSNCSILSKSLNRRVECVLDPTLLLDKNTWNKIALSYPLPKKKYILAYILGERELISEYAEKLGKLKNLPVYYIVTRPRYLTKINKIEGVGPSHFISLIRDASYVVTDSFHGSVFSINFNVNFYSFSKLDTITKSQENDNARILEILSDFYLTNRFKSEKDLSFNEDIDYTQVNILLNNSRKKSMDYLYSILK